MSPTESHPNSSNVMFQWIRYRCMDECQRLTHQQFFRLWRFLATFPPWTASTSKSVSILHRKLNRTISIQLLHASVFVPSLTFPIINQSDRWHSMIWFRILFWLIADRLWLVNYFSDNRRMDVSFVVNPSVTRYRCRDIDVTELTLCYVVPCLIVTLALADISILRVPRNRLVQPPRCEICRRCIFAVGH